MALGNGEATREAKELNKELGFILEAVSSLGDQLTNSFQEAVDGATNLNSAIDVVGKTMQRGLIADLKNAVKNTESLIDLQSKVTRGVATQRDISKESEKIALNRARLTAKEFVLGSQLTDVQQQLIDEEKQQLTLQQEALNNIINQNIQYQKSKSLTTLLKENIGDIANRIDKTGTLSKVLSGNFMDTVTPLRLAELAIVGIFNAAKALDEQTGKLAKNLNISYKEATALNIEFTKASNKTGDVFITTKGLGEALKAVNGELGIFNTTIDKNLITFQKLHKTAGLTYDELGGVNKITQATGGDLEKNTTEIMAQARLTGQKFKVALNEKDVLKDISKVSAATTLSLGKNPGQIAAAVATAKALGMEMSKIEGIADSLLNFESSITKELEAELLIGKSLNLEKARQFALNNDIEGVAREIAKQAGSAADFGKMNRIQQEALAGAVGMSREELSKSLFVQEQIGNLTGDEYDLRAKQINELEAKGLSQAEIKKQLGKDSIENLKAQNSVQEKLSNSVDKMKEIFVSIAGPLMQIISPIVDLLIPAISSIAFLLEPVFTMFRGISGILTNSFDTLSGWGKVLGSIGVATLAYMGYQKVILGYEAAKTTFGFMQNALQASRRTEVLKENVGLVTQLGVRLGILSAALGTNAAATFGVGVAIAVAAALAGYTAIKAITGDDVVSPGGSGSGYGTRTLMGPEGAISLNNKDTVIAGTNLFPKDNSTNTQPQHNTKYNNTNKTQDNSKMENLLSQLLKQNANRPDPIIQMSGDKLGTAVGKYAYSTQ